MSEPVTEIASLPLVAGTDLTTGDAKGIWDEVLKTVSSQPGCQSLFWGRQVENPDIVQFAIGWDKLESHRAFEASEGYGPFMAKFRPLMASDPHLFHLKLPSSSTTTVLSAPITECISLYFQPSHSTSAYDNNWASFVDAASKVPSDAQGIAGGWGIEGHQHEKFGKEREDGDAKYFGAFIGWPSVDAHLEFRKKGEFPEVIKFLRDGPEAVKVCHVHFEKYL